MSYCVIKELTTTVTSGRCTSNILLVYINSNEVQYLQRSSERELIKSVAQDVFHGEMRDKWYARAYLARLFFS